MSNTLSLILCIPFLIGTLLFGSDLILIQTIYSSLDSISSSVSYKIANTGVDNLGNVDRSILTYLNESVGATLIKGDKNKTSYMEGDYYTYILEKEYRPFVIRKEPIKIQIKRYAIIGINHS